MGMQLNTEESQKRELHKKRHFSFRLNFFFFCTFLLFCILIVRLAMLQFVEGEHLSELESRSTISSHSIPPIRGNIYDRNEDIIAWSSSTQSLFLRVEPNQSRDSVIDLAYRLEKVFQQYGEINKTLTAAEIIKNMDVGYDLNKNATTAPSFYSVPRKIKTGLTQTEIAYLAEHRDEFNGLEISEESIRNYKNTNQQYVAAQLVGYLRNFSTARGVNNGLQFYQNIFNLDKEAYLDNEEVGFDGIELMYQEELRGQNGRKEYPINAVHKIVGNVTIQPPIKGSNLFLTIDTNVQLDTQQAIMEHLQVLQTSTNPNIRAEHAKIGYAVAMEVDTGKVIAMASMPDYDPNVWKGGRISHEDLKKIEFNYLNGTIREVRPKYEEQRDLNRHATSLVYLGSTMKPLTVLMGLNENLITANEIYFDTGKFIFGRAGSEVTIHNSGKVAMGGINAQQAITRSSNVYMSEIGNRLYLRNSDGLNVWDQYMEKFGLGVLTGSGLQGESRGLKDYIADAVNSSRQNALVRASWGQLGKYTTLQLAQYAAMLGNQGKRMRPLFVEKIVSSDGQQVKNVQSEILNEEQYPQAYWDVLHKGMLEVFKAGFEGFPHAVASKTGTSTQFLAGTREVNNAVFIAYAPADKPKLAVAVVIPEGGFGSQGAAPIARKIFESYDKHIGLTVKK